VMHVTVLVGRRLDVSTALLPWVSERLAYSCAADRMKFGTNQPTNQPIKVITKGGDLRGAQVDVPWSV
jgi:hypothetical protein